MIHRCFLSGLVLACLICRAGVAQQQGAIDSNRARIKQQVQAKLQELYESADVPGASVAVVLPDGDVVTATVGFANREEKTPMQAEDRMMSASIGKTYFAAMALELMLADRLALDDSVSKYLGNESWFERIPNAESLTIAHLMRHQSGIPRYVFVRQVWEDALANPDKTWKPGEQLEYIYDRRPIHPAGEGWAYSDTNYILLGMIMEKVTGQSVYDYVRDRFLKPNRLDDTLPNDRRQLPGLIQGYSKTFKPLGVPDRVIQKGKFVFNPQMEWCGGGFLSTASDLARWTHLYFSGKAIQGDYLPMMTRDAANSSAMLGRGSKYGLGVIIRPTNLGNLLGHDGGFPGYSSTTGYFPDQQIAVSLMYNSDHARALPKPAYRVAIEIAEVVVKEIK